MICRNGADPLLMSWTNITVSADRLASNRGIKIAIGTPPQNFSLRPTIVADNLFVSNFAECGSVFNGSCIGRRGGVYDPDVSTTTRSSSLSAWNGTPDALLSGETYIYLNDILNFGQNTTIYGYPFMMDQPGWTGKSLLHSSLPING